MEDQRTLARPQVAPHCDADNNRLPDAAASRATCLVELLLAFWDLADRDDIHQASRRLDIVQQWIRDEAERAARDPIFADLLPI